MRLHLMSDLHLDHSPEHDRAFLDELKPAPDVDLLVLAGDTYSRATKHTDVFRRLLDCYQTILVVPGNHDYWGASPDFVEESLQKEVAEVDDDGRIYLALQPSWYAIAGRLFFAGTLWYRKPTKGQLEFIDMRMTNTPREWFYEQQARFEHRMTGNPMPDLGRPIFVSHHLPSEKSTPKEFLGAASNHFFMCDMEKQLAALDVKPAAWLHGHTHDACDYMLGETRVVCNPRGYPHEHTTRAPYAPLLIEIDE